MTEIIIFETEINSKNIELLINGCQEIMGRNNQFQIYFSSSGGDVAAGNILIDFLNAHPDNILVANEEISSTAFLIFCKAQCRRKIIPGTFAVVHITECEINTRELADDNSYANFLLNEIKRQNNNEIDFFRKLGLTKNELNRLKRGKDVYLDYTRLKKMLEER